MSLVNITEAAELVDKSTQTLYRHIRSGKLSRGSDGLIQTAELIRVYGELKQVENNNVVSNDNLIQHSDINVITSLQQQVDKLERDLQALKTEGLERERQAIEREKRLMALLENQSGKKDSGSLFNRFFK